MQKRRVAVVGVGLIGGSLAIQLHEKKISTQLLGVESNPEHADTSLELELVDEITSLEDAVKRSEVIILSIPVDGLMNLLPAVLDMVTDQIVIDIGSTKEMLLDKVKNHPKRGRYVATHPMWGTEYHGPQSAVRGAFQNKALIICNAEQSDKDAVSWTKWMFQKIGMHIIEMNGVDHDIHTAYISHISHITSFALANTVLEKEKEDQAIFELASSGFESTVRLAKSHSAMWLPIFIQNRENVLDVLNEHITQLLKFKSCLEEKQWKELNDLIEQANQIKRILK